MARHKRYAFPPAKHIALIVGCLITAELKPGHTSALTSIAQTPSIPLRASISVTGSLRGFLLAKDSLIKSSHACHPIAGQGAAAWRGSALPEYESLSNPGKLWANVTKGF